MIKKTYSEKLRDPRWQRRRLEILDLNDFKCSSCGAKDDMLHVHHILYRKGAEPWEYSDEELRCLCEFCHECAEDVRLEILRFFSKYGHLDVEQWVVRAFREIEEKIESGTPPMDALWGFFQCSKHSDLMDEAAKRHPFKFSAE